MWGFAFEPPFHSVPKIIGADVESKARRQIPKKRREARFVAQRCRGLGATSELYELAGGETAESTPGVLKGLAEFGKVYCRGGYSVEAHRRAKRQGPRPEGLVLRPEGAVQEDRDGSHEGRGASGHRRVVPNPFVATLL